MSGVFINYRSQDSSSYGALLHLALARRFGDPAVFLDSESIPAGSDYVEQLLTRVRECRVLLAVIGPTWLTAADSAGRRRIDDPADWIRRELVEAFAAGVRVIPVLVDGPQCPVWPSCRTISPRWVAASSGACDTAMPPWTLLASRLTWRPMRS